jgi:hypothetical protein
MALTGLYRILKVFTILYHGSLIKKFSKDTKTVYYAHLWRAIGRVNDSHYRCGSRV